MIYLNLKRVGLTLIRRSVLSEF